ncbi:hypothetical protein ACFPVT_01910 [Corynebacterium choanae]|nr:hypothetical protein [Corynebacterium choanae]
MHKRLLSIVVTAGIAVSATIAPASALTVDKGTVQQQVQRALEAKCEALPNAPYVGALIKWIMPGEGEEKKTVDELKAILDTKFDEKAAYKKLITDRKNARVQIKEEDVPGLREFMIASVLVRAVECGWVADPENKIPTIKQELDKQVEKNNSWSSIFESFSSGLSS